MKPTNRKQSVGAQPRVGSAGPGHLGSHTSAVSLAVGVLLAVLLLVVPGAIVAWAGRMPVAAAVAVGPALTYGVVALAIVPFGAIGIPWNAFTAFFALAVVTAVAAGLPILLNRFRDTEAEELSISRGPALVAAAGVVLGAVLIGAGGGQGTSALAVDPQHVGRRLARQHGSLDPRHRAGVADAHGRAPQCRNP